MPDTRYGFAFTARGNQADLALLANNADVLIDKAARTGEVLDLTGRCTDDGLNDVVRLGILIQVVSENQKAS